MSTFFLDDNDHKVKEREDEIKDKKICINRKTLQFKM